MSIRRAQGPGPARGVPSSTYRIQLRSGVDFDRVAEVVPYLARLGIGWLYLSPPFTARAGSTHGYDVVDPNQLDPALGGEPAFRRLLEQAKRQKLQILVDIVPNHVATDPQNPYWWDVLAAGRSSEHAEMFDVDWQATGDKLHLPVLGADLALVLEREQIAITLEQGELRARYFDLALPLAPSSYELLLEPLLAELDGDSRAQIEQLLAAARGADDAARRRALSARLRALPEPALSAIERAAARCQGAALAQLLEQQVYRLRDWRGPAPLNYRRFFTISELAGVRAERPSVFEQTHALALSLLADGSIDGLRVDHPDGMRDPVGYVELLASAMNRVRPDEPPYLVLEKILHADEPLDPALPVDGTTGYEALRVLDAVFVDAAGAQRVLDTYMAFTGRGADFAAVAQAAKKRVLDQALAPELVRLAELASAELGVDPEVVLPLLRELVACFPVYRSYVREQTESIDAEDRRVLETAFALARDPDPERGALLDRLRSLLFSPAGSPGRELLLKLQQLTGPAAAKGIEDTAFYRWFPLSSLCEVGGSPELLGIDLQRFHDDNAARAVRFPHTMLASSTHDTKRSEDVRSRIHALSEMPELWASAIASWGPLNQKLKREVDGELAPDANDEWLIYQTLLGIWPLDGDASSLGDRIEQYLVKALREAKRSSAWTDPNPAYERAAVEFARALLDPKADPEFVRTFSELERRVARAGALTSLSRLVLKATCPGVPDFYQGNELWDLSLVDPDNRRPVDFDDHARLLAELERSSDPRALLDAWRDGRIKLWLTHRLLELRRRRAALFAFGSHHGVSADGPAAERVIAFSRRYAGESLLVVVGRYFAQADTAGFSGTSLAIELPDGHWADALTGAHHAVTGGRVPSVSELLRDLPFCVLERAT